MHTISATSVNYYLQTNTYTYLSPSLHGTCYRNKVKWPNKISMQFSPSFFQDGEVAGFAIDWLTTSGSILNSKCSRILGHT